MKAREAMLHAVQGFNNPRAHFKSETFIVVAMIAFTDLLHWHYRRNGVDIRYKRMIDKVETALKTRHGADKYWELESCLIVQVEDLFSDRSLQSGSNPCAAGTA